MTLIYIASRLATPAGSPATFNFYLGPSGNDTTGDGSIGNPWAITAINSKAALIAGKRVGLLDGTYRISGAGDEYLLELPATASGTSGAHTIIEAVNPRLAIVTTNNGSGVYPQGTGGIGAIDTIRINGSYVEFKNIKLDQLGGHGLVVMDGDNVLIEGCWFKDIYGKRKTSMTDDNLGAIYTRTQTTPKVGCTVRNCLFEDVYALNQTIQNNDSCGIGSMFGAEDWVIEYCTFRRCGKAAYYKNYDKNITFRYNVVTDCSGFIQTPSVARTGDNSSNYIYGCIARVNWCFGQNSSNIPGDAADVFEMYNNTIIMDNIGGTNVCDFGFMNFQGGSNSQALKFYNNAIFLNAGFALGPGMLRFPPSTQNPSSRIVVWNYNRYSRFSVSDDVNSTSYTSLPWAGHDANSPAVGSLGLVDQTGSTPADFTPNIGSALLNAGTVDGVGGAACDIGWTRYATVGHDW